MRNDDPTSQCVVASLRKFKAQTKQEKLPLNPGKIYLWVCHATEPYTNKRKLMALVNLVQKIYTSETEVHIVLTGYLNRYNFYSAGKLDEASQEDFKKAVTQGRDQQDAWKKQYGGIFSPLNPTFLDWEGCIASQAYKGCVEELKEELDQGEKTIKKRGTIEKAIDDTVSQHMKNHSDRNLHNSKGLVKEELAWLMAVAGEDPNTGAVPLIHLGEKSKAIKTLFNEFDLNENITWLSPNFDTKGFKTKGQLRRKYKNKKFRFHGFSAAIEDPEILKPVSTGSSTSSDSDSDTSSDTLEEEKKSDQQDRKQSVVDAQYPSKILLGFFSSSFSQKQKGKDSLHRSQEGKESANNLPLIFNAKSCSGSFCDEKRQVKSPTSLLYAFFQFPSGKENTLVFSIDGYKITGTKAYESGKTSISIKIESTQSNNSETTQTL